MGFSHPKSYPATSTTPSHPDNQQSIRQPRSPHPTNDRPDYRQLKYSAALLAQRQQRLPRGHRGILRPAVGTGDKKIGPSHQRTRTTHRDDDNTSAFPTGKTTKPAANTPYGTRNTRNLDEHEFTASITARLLLLAPDSFPSTA